ncbi:MAG: RsmD family RNA methyltransferase [Planctomycetota bacterium]
MSLRIIAGTWRQRRIEAPPGRSTRPLPDRIKQSLFDWLGQRCDGWRVIDCCAGSGSFGFEAASRGAVAVDLIEHDPAACALLERNRAGLPGASERCRIHRADACAILPGLGTCDLVFADPPFPWYATQRERLEQLIAAAAAALGEDGRLLLRGERGQDSPSPPTGLRETERRSYGRSWVSLLRRA